MFGCRRGRGGCRRRPLPPRPCSCRAWCFPVGIRKVTAGETRIFEHDMTNSTQQLQRINMHPRVEGHDVLVLLTDLFGLRMRTSTKRPMIESKVWKDTIQTFPRTWGDGLRWAKEQMTGYGLPTSLTVLEAEAPIGPK